MSILEKLSEGIVRRDMSKEGAALLNKWEKTGLLEGLESDHDKNTMAVLLENQTKELLREANTMAGGSVEGFAAVAFPIVRRVFGSLVANELVSVQSMSLPSGLIFFLDFTKGDTISGRLPSETGNSLFGGGVVGSQITGGVDLTAANAESGFYSLNGDGFSAALGHSRISGSGVVHEFASMDLTASLSDDQLSAIRYDPDLLGTETVAFVVKVPIDTTGIVNHSVSGTNNIALRRENPLQALKLEDTASIDTFLGSGGAGTFQVRRLTQFVEDPAGDYYRLVFQTTGSSVTTKTAGEAIGNQGADINYPIKDNLTAANALGAVVGATPWDLEGSTELPEIDIKVDSVAITAVTKKLKAKWTPELAQDLNAYHNLDAEVELTGILSEQIALEIDQEILQDLVKGATARVAYWSRRPGKFVNRDTGGAVEAWTSGVTSGTNLLGADFTGTVSEWYETLLETINDVSADIHRKTLRGGANFLVCGPETAAILEMTAGFRAAVTVDADRGMAGAVKVGSLNKKWDIYVDPYFRRNLVLVGRKGASFLESGYVYAPYVPLQVTPTIFDPDDFTPRKAVMTRYGKKMVRPDMYGLVVIEDMEG
jgi:hypothetical protein